MLRTMLAPLLRPIKYTKLLPRAAGTAPIPHSYSTRAKSPFDNDTEDPSSDPLQPIEEILPTPSSSKHTTHLTSSHKPIARDPAPHEWLAHRQTMKRLYPEGWNPPKKLSRENMDQLRYMHNLDPNRFTTPVLAAQFKISSEAVRRILSSKWEPREDRRQELVEKDVEKREAKVEEYRKARERRKRARDKRQLRMGVAVPVPSPPRTRRPQHVPSEARQRQQAAFRERLPKAKDGLYLS